MFVCTFLQAHATASQTENIKDIPDPFAGYVLPENIGFKLTAIVETKNNGKAALLRIRRFTKKVVEGDIVKDWTIEKIEKDFILISKGGELKQLWLVPPL